ncbi:MAG: ATP-binding protein [Candidatus Acidoferrales bacterium]
MRETPAQPRRREFRWRSLALILVALLLALATLGAVVGAVVNFGQRARYVRPYDGIDWDQTPQGVRATIVWQDTPGDWAGIRPGDILYSIDAHPIQRPSDVAKHHSRAQPGTQLTYELLRRLGGRDQPVTATLLANPQPDPFSLRGFVEFVGLLYLGIGVFVLFKRWNAPHAVHFYLVCLASFIFYSFSYGGARDTFDLSVFDLSIYWTDVVARLLLPALFLHFALAFPKPKPWFQRRRWLFALVYMPAAALLALRLRLLPSPPEVSWLLDRPDRNEFTHLAVLFLLAAAVFEYTYRSAREPILVQQMKWVTRGTWLAILPFTTFYVIPRFFLDYVPTDWMKLSTLALVFIPLMFGYAVIRYRLMDVDIIFRRGVAYTLATAVIAALYFGLAAAAATLFEPRVGFGTEGVIIAIIIAAILFQPIKDWTQLQLERLFYQERFDYRRTLEGFGRELSSEIHLDRLLAKLLDRLRHTLPVDRMAILLEGEDEPGTFRLARGQGFGPGATGLPFHPQALPWPEVRRIQSGELTPLFPPEEQQRLQEFGLHHFLPCCIQNRTIALLALGPSSGGTLLTSEDLDLLRTLADYIAIALENARLYERLQEKAAQVAQLKEFSENILESTSVGLVALDPNDRIESWNSSVERICGRSRQETLGRRAAEVFPPELVAELEAGSPPGTRATSDSSPWPHRPARSLYKFYLSRPDGTRRVTNFTVAPLVGKQGAPIGRLLIIDDITERVQLERQLLQAEKLSSVGLLAAGVAHEVNTPLAVISNYAQMLAKQMPADDQRAALVEKIVKQTFRASEIISGLLSFSRTAATEFGQVDLNRTLRDTLVLVQPQLRSSQVEIKTLLDNTLPPISGDPGRLQQVFLNLLFNARDAMPQGGCLTVRTGCHNSRAQVEIRDTGVGIPAENLSKLYDPFFTTKTTGRGTGLGLAVSYGIIQEHKGTIEVRSRPGQGTSFLLEFPLPAPVPPEKGN